jgi:hypothetical protein
VDGLLDAIDGQLAVIDHGGVIVRTNQAWSALDVPGARAGRNYPLGTNYLSAVNAALADALRAVLRDGTPYSAE